MTNDVEMVDQSGSPKVAILDAGAQYGKVINKAILHCVN